MHRYFIHMAFDGSAYHGWQTQPNGITIQGVLEDALTKLTGHAIQVTGAGRTDAGVHASCFIAHFDLPGTKGEPPGELPSESPGEPTPEAGPHLPVAAPDDPQFLFRLNRFLPPDIVVYRIQEVPPELHARFSATYRTYHYHISTVKPLFTRNFSHYHYGKLDLDAIRTCCTILLETEDFTSFSKLHTDVKTHRCRVSKAEWSEEANGYLFEIRADRFLRNMVRSIVGTLLDVGQGKLSPGEFQAIAEARDRSRAGQSAPAKGLFLVDIGYENLKF